jgi:integrase
MYNIGRKGLIDLKGGIPSDNPASAVKFLDEPNIRDRVLTRDEFDRMLGASPEYLKPVLISPFHTSMREGEILGFTWDRVDLKNGLIRLKREDSKTGERRHIPIGKKLRSVLQGLPRNVSHQRVLTPNGQPIKAIREVITRDCRDAGLTDVVFHDLRHTATAKLRRAGMDALTAMKIKSPGIRRQRSSVGTTTSMTMTSPSPRTAWTPIWTPRRGGAKAKCFKYLFLNSAGVAEWVDAQDLKSISTRLR